MLIILVILKWKEQEAKHILIKSTMQKKTNLLKSCSRDQQRAQSNTIAVGISHISEQRIMCERWENPE